MKNDDLIEFEGTLQEFIDKIKFTKKSAGILKKKYGKAYIEVYWHDYDRTKEKWFMNVNTKYTGKKEDHDVWVIEKDLFAHLDYLYIRDDYKMYFIKNEELL